MPQEDIAVPRALRDLAAVHSPEFGLYASAGPLYGRAFFGRDALETAEDIVAFNRAIPERVLLACARLQGMKDEPASEEEPGRIHHEYRTRVIDGREVGDFSRRIIAELGPAWGGTEEGFCYYGSVDATPLFLRLLARFDALYPGAKILRREVPLRAGRTMAQAAAEAASWIERRIASSNTGFIESKRANPKGILNQVWMDSATSYVDVDGRYPDYRFGVASVEVQGLAYDALRAAAEMETDGARAVELWRSAEELKSRLLEKFWMPESRYFAHAVCRKDGAPARIDTPSSNAAVLLDTTLFDELPPDERREYVSGLVEGVYGPDFLTPVGIRCRSLRHADAVPLADYHGSMVVWAKQGFDIAKGLRRQGFPRLGEQVERRILNGVNVAGKNYEFLYVDAEGRVHYDPERQPAPEEKARPIVGTNIPEVAQAWTVAAILGIKRRMRNSIESRLTRELSWETELEDRLLAANPLVPRLGSREAVRARKKVFTPFRIDTVLATKIDALLRERLDREAADGDVAPE
jgi:glycogen debranching enzyme